MIRADDVLNATFTQTQLVDGYDEREVDDLLDRAVGALRHHEAGTAGPADLTAAALRDARFTSTRFRRGYAMAEVDAMLEQVVAALAEHEGVPVPPDPQAARAVTPSGPATGAASAASGPVSGASPRPSVGRRLLALLRGDPR